MPSKPMVFIVDDDEAFADSLTTMLTVRGYRARVYGSGLAFLDEYDPDVPGCLLLDVRMPDIDGLDLQERLKADGSILPVIILTGHGDIPMSVRSMRAGAVDFLEKPLDTELLYSAIERAMSLVKETVAKVAEASRTQALIARLSPRERQIFELLILGQSNKVIGAELGISPRTVEMHRSHLMLKMQSDSLSSLVRLGLTAGIIPATT